MLKHSKRTVHFRRVVPYLPSASLDKSQGMSGMVIVRVRRTAHTNPDRGRPYLTWLLSLQHAAPMRVEAIQGPARPFSQNERCCFSDLADSQTLSIEASVHHDVKPVQWFLVQILLTCRLPKSMLFINT